MWQNSADLQEIVNDTLFTGTSADDLNDEIRHNMWRISFGADERTRLSVDILEEFFTAVIENRRQQLLNSGSAHSMIFYVWHDAMASQLRFNLISDFHDTLPFKAEVITVPLADILREFLASPPEISWSELTIQDDSAGVFVESTELVHRVKVFRTLI